MSLIYHHTTTDGIIGILENQAIWATDIKFLNDYDEFLIGLQEITTTTERNKHSRREESYASQIVDLYNSLEENLRKNLLGRSVFIASFTKTRDNLRQWMSYGRPNSSYSIGFERSLLENMPLDPQQYRSDELAYKFGDVDYEMNSLISRSLNFEHITKLLKKGAIEDIVRDIFNDAMFGCCLIKRKQFSDENEARMVLQTRKIDMPCAQSKFRNWGGVITPYINIPIPINAIKEIIIGPNINKNLAELGLIKLLQKWNIECKISHSECTLRQY